MKKRRATAPPNFSTLCHRAKFFTKRRATASRWHPTGSRGLVCDFGRKLEKLSMPVNTQCCAAKDGSTSLNVPRMARLRRTRPSAATPHQAYLDFLIFAQRNKPSPGSRSDATNTPRHPPFSKNFTLTPQIRKTTAPPHLQPCCRY